MAATTQHLAKGANAWTELGIIPTILPSVPAHTTSIDVGGVKITPGSEVTPKQVTALPRLEWPHTSSDLFTVIVIDPDVPSRKTPLYDTPHNHAAYVNVPGNNISAGESNLPYFGPAPPQGTGLHRYLWLIYKQENGRVQLPSADPSNRAKWNYKSWLNTVSGGNNQALRLVSANFWQAQFQG